MSPHAAANARELLLNFMPIYASSSTASKTVLAMFVSSLLVVLGMICTWPKAVSRGGIVADVVLVA